MALYDTRFGLPQSVVDYLNQGLPSILQPTGQDMINLSGPSIGQLHLSKLLPG
jgi:hypothetical protein